MARPTYKQAKAVQRILEVRDGKRESISRILNSWDKQEASEFIGRNYLSYSQAKKIHQREAREVLVNMTAEEWHCMTPGLMGEVA